ncbi:dCMP deaminase family protein [Paraburkholderia caffeinilytica]
MESDGKFMRLALEVAQLSNDRSRKVGCVIVGPDNEIRSTGYNSFPVGIIDSIEKRHERPAKYMWTEHAERNAIYNAAKHGVSINGCKMYLPWFPCIDCSRAIIQAGIVELIAIEPDVRDDRWGSDFSVSLEMLREAGIRLRFVECNVEGIPT